MRIIQDDGNLDFFSMHCSSPVKLKLPTLNLHNNRTRQDKIQ